MLTHVWGLMAHPNREWKQIKQERETITHLYAHHVLLLAAIPVICSYIGTTQVGWSLGGGHDHQAQLSRRPGGGDRLLSGDPGGGLHRRQDHPLLG